MRIYEILIVLYKGLTNAKEQLNSAISSLIAAIRFIPTLYSAAALLYSPTFQNAEHRSPHV